MTELNLIDFVKDKDNCTTAIAEAIGQLATSGGKLCVPKGLWQTAAIELKSNIELHLAKGAVIKFLNDPELYPPVWTRWEGVECYAMHPLLYAVDSCNISITGEEGATFDGAGQRWWDLRNAQKKNAQKEPQKPYELKFAKLNPNYQKQPGGGGGRETQFMRPSMIEFFKCNNITLEGITIKNSPFWTVHPVFTNDLLIKNCIIQNPATAPNTDGIDIDSCRNVHIEGCTVSVGDDGICLKSGSGIDGIRRNIATSNVTIEGCTVRNAHGGIVIGSETAAGINTVVATNCDFPQTDRGIRIKSRRGRGGKIYNITLKNLSMEDNKCPIAINMFYRCGITDENSPLFSLNKQPITKETPIIYDITIQGCKATGCKSSAGFIAGLPESPITGLSICNCQFQTDETSTDSPMDSDMFFGLPEVNVKSFRVINAPNAKFDNVTIQGPKDEFIYE